MTGLDSETESIMSICCFVTDYDLNLLDENGYEAFVHHTKERLDQMGEWCTSHHAASGLTQACIDSQTTAEEAAAGLVDYVKTYCPEPKKALLAGNTVHADARFLLKQPYQPLMKHLGHRILDVSAMKEAMKRWAPVEVMKATPKKAGKHEARADILESIAEAKFHRDIYRNARLPVKTDEAEASHDS